MCGVVGIISFGGRRIEEEEVANLTATLNHRGPDGSGTFINAAGNVALGHTRLAILDISNDASQPMTDQRENLTISFNGEIYNFLELKNELMSLGHVFTNMSDTEVILCGFIEWKEDLFLKMNGMWSIIIWDEENKTLYSCRDRFGVKPLYYLKMQNRIIFSSETQSFQIISPSRSINRKVLSDTLHNVYHTEGTSSTIYEDCFSLPPGTLMRIDSNGKIEHRKWWSIEDHIDELDVGRITDHVEEFRELFSDACRLRMRSDAHISTALSGGLDSSVVFAQCMEIALNDPMPRSSRQKPVSTPHTISLPGSEWDETRYAIAIADMYGTGIHKIEPNMAEFFENLVAKTKHFDNIRYLPDITHQAYERMRSNGFKISIDGHGADEIFFGYPDMIDTYNSKIDLRGFTQPPSFRDSLKTRLRQMRAKADLKSSFFLRRNANSRPWIYRAPTWPRCYSGRPLNRDQEISINEIYHYRLPTILRNFDQGSMLHGIEIRSPFLDWRLVTKGISLASGEKFDSHNNKKIVRQAFEGRIPDCILNRKDKIGINSPLETWMLESPSMFLDILHDRKFLESDIWDGRVIRDYFCDIISKKVVDRHTASRIWPIINAHILMN
ncbi:MAG: asparagine synthase (glutamine-hydrolyzing) [Minwuia sp.]|nr:asparagine synthase (glutamine-hydrolyzing) [Minwuia sp.]